MKTRDATQPRYLSVRSDTVYCQTARWTTTSTLTREEARSVGKGFSSLHERVRHACLKSSSSSSSSRPILLVWNQARPDGHFGDDAVRKQVDRVPSGQTQMNGAACISFRDPLCTPISTSQHTQETAKSDQQSQPPIAHRRTGTGCAHTRYPEIEPREAATPDAADVVCTASAPPNARSQSPHATQPTPHGCSCRRARPTHLRSLPQIRGKIAVLKNTSA